MQELVRGDHIPIFYDNGPPVEPVFVYCDWHSDNSPRVEHELSHEHSQVRACLETTALFLSD